LFAAYHADPTLLPDHVLFRFRELATLRYLRDVPLAALDAEIAERYRPDPRFARLLADHLAAMTDPYAVAEHETLMRMGAIPIPSAEQLRREES
jgi:dGTP triphosphohydrolase